MTQITPVHKVRGGQRERSSRGSQGARRASWRSRSVVLQEAFPASPQPLSELGALTPFPHENELIMPFRAHIPSVFPCCPPI